MGIRVVPPTFSGTGGAVKVGRAVWSYPEGSKVAYYTDAATGVRLALVFIPASAGVRPWGLRVLAEEGEILGIPARLLRETERRYSPGMR